MADFEGALLETLKNEGGYVNDPSDMGGETYCGITKRDHPEWEGWDILSMGYLTSTSFSLIQTLISQLYLEKYWKPSRAEQITDQAVASKYFDMCVNMGQGNGARILQQSIKVMMLITVDGKIGPQTIRAANKCGKGLLNVMKILHGAYYLKLIQRKPNQIRFINGWLKRAMQGE